MVENFGSHIGAYCYNVYEKRNKVCENCPVIESYRTGQVTKGLRVGIGKNGVLFRSENIASVLKNEQGDIIAGIELCRNVEEREKAFDDLKQITKKLKHTQKQLVQSEKLAGIGQLAAGVAREINNPASFVMSNLNAIQNYVDDFFSYVESLEKIISANLPDDQQKAEIIKENVKKVVEDKEYSYLKDELPLVIKESLAGMQRIKSIVSNLMIFACPSGTGASLVDTNAQIEASLLLVENEIKQKCRVVKEYGRLPKVRANPQQIEQMFVNMILNASQAIKVKGTIGIKTYLKDDRVHIEIADGGVGIPQEVISLIHSLPPKKSERAQGWVFPSLIASSRSITVVSMCRASQVTGPLSPLSCR